MTTDVRLDLVLRGAQIADRSAAPATRADVRVRGRHIAEVGDILAREAEQTVDLSGLLLALGFIDPHTHYDAQVFWDPELNLTCWHGVLVNGQATMSEGVPVPNPGSGMLLRAGSS